MSDIYKQRSNWKTILAITGFIILIITLFYSNYLAKSLELNEQKNADLFVKALEFLTTNEDYNEDVEILDQIINNFPLPAIIKNEDGSLSAHNFSVEQNDDVVFLQSKIKEFLASGNTPLRGGENYPGEIYYFNSKLLDYIKYYPLVQIFLVGSFIALGYFQFNASRKAEQNRVWAGMAKETAHQLGTPISAILAWVMHLRENTIVSEDQAEVLDELENDVDRLNLIADRFSKIGSNPDLVPKNLVLELDEVKTYMARRSPRKVIFSFPLLDSTPFISKINSHLFAWVIENLIRNSLDAMDSTGQITATLHSEDGWNIIELSDTGKGIPTSKFKTVFQPGYSTKQRGWGLGLSLAKRIIEQYHSGKIIVKTSKPGEGTTFQIKLPQDSAIVQA